MIPTLNQFENFTDKKANQKVPAFDFYLVDDLTIASQLFKPTGQSITIVHFKNMPSEDAQTLSEIEIMARSGFLSIVGMTTVAIS